jgi:anhydro-N-acetylmuramic acid kinase
MKVVGLMSGTSGDGVDAALVEIHGQGHKLRVKTLAFRSLPYPPGLRSRILTASIQGSVAEICHLNTVLGEWFAKSALRLIKHARLRPSEVHLIGSHGQTIYHQPRPVREPSLGLVRSTLQIAEPAVITERTGITTVADFRQRDVAAGGQGAPLTPYVHYLLLRHARRSRLIVNLGGISNVTHLPASGGLRAVRAFDTGPGNMVLDALASRFSGGRQSMDRGGRLAAKGTVDTRLLNQLLAHPFLRRKPPKTTGREEFGETFLAKILSAKRTRRLSMENTMATCSLFTAVTVGTARRWLRGPVDEVIVGGGGVHNHTLMADLAAVFEPTPVRTLEALGWESKAFESVSFAVLAYQTLNGTCGNLVAATGARHPVILGKMVPAGPTQRIRLR